MSVTVPTRKVLWTRAHDMCAFPACGQALTVDGTAAASGELIVTVLGEEAHIRSSKPNGPRHDPRYPKEKLDSEENLILLCPTHHTMIDANNGAGYDVDDLVGMRQEHYRRQDRRSTIDKTIRTYLALQYESDDEIHFHQVDLHGPTVESMFVDVPFGCRPDAKVADLMSRIADQHPGDSDVSENSDGRIVTGAAQALLHPDWSSSALLVGGPGQGKSTLLQYVCQFHRSRFLGRDTYSGEDQNLVRFQGAARLPIRLDLRKYAQWANDNAYIPKARSKRDKQRSRERQWPSVEEYIVSEITKSVPGAGFTLRDLSLMTETAPVLIALDGLDEVANLKHREQVSTEIVKTHTRLVADAISLVVLVATRPGGTTSALSSSQHFPALILRRLSPGLRLQYLQRWAAISKLTTQATMKLQKMFLDNQHVPHIRELASSPMQLAILLHLLHRRQLLPQQRTELYREYLKTFLDREETEVKEPLLAEERKVIEDIHAYLGWYLQSRAEEGKSDGSIPREELRKLVHEHLDGRADGQKLAKKLFSAISTRVLCLVERDTGSFQFEVQSLREYFAALYIFENAPVRGLGNSRDDCLNALLERPYWSNVCRFFVGMLSKGEVRGIRENLRQVSAKVGEHPMVRSMAALFLDDRTYEGQADDPIQEVVDFILAGPGAVLAEDGLLNVSGAALVLAERAGRTQAVRHLKNRLEQNAPPATRELLASSLLQQAGVEDDLSGWWWGRFDTAASWLETASQLGVLGSLDGQQTNKLQTLLSDVDWDRQWITELLVQGEFDGKDDGVLAIVKHELNQGAGEILTLSISPTPIGRLTEAAMIAQLRTSRSRTGKERELAAGTASRRTRRGTDSSILANTTATTDQLRDRPVDSATSSAWQERLLLIAQTWGDGWILRQAIARLPVGLDLDTMAVLVRSNDSVLATALTVEASTRANSGNSDWWRQQIVNAVSGFEKRQWILRLLSSARSPVVTALAQELNEQVDALQPKYLSSMEASLSNFLKSRVLRELSIQEDLRLNQVQFSPKSLLLVRAVANESSVERIDKRIANELSATLNSDISDMRKVVRAIGAQKTVRIEALRGGRRVLPPGGWASDIKLGAMSYKLAEEILGAPQDWPSDIVLRAVEKLSERIADKFQPLAAIADTDRWFQSQ